MHLLHHNLELPLRYHWRDNHYSLLTDSTITRLDSEYLHVISHSFSDLSCSTDLFFDAVNPAIFTNGNAPGQVFFDQVHDSFKSVIAQQECPAPLQKNPLYLPSESLFPEDPPVSLLSGDTENGNSHCKRYRSGTCYNEQPDVTCKKQEPAS